MDTPTLIAGFLVAALAYCFAHAMLTVLTHRLSTRLAKHQVILDAHRRRAEYYTALAQRAARVSGASLDDLGMTNTNETGGFNVDIVEDDAPPLTQATPLTQAAPPTQDTPLAQAA